MEEEKQEKKGRKKEREVQGGKHPKGGSQRPTL